MVLLSHLWYSMVMSLKVPSPTVVASFSLQCVVLSTANMGTTKWGQENQEHAGGMLGLEWKQMCLDIPGLWTVESQKENIATEDSEY